MAAERDVLVKHKATSSIVATAALLTLALAPAMTSAQDRLQGADFSYLGAFRLPGGDERAVGQLQRQVQQAPGLGSSSRYHEACRVWLTYLPGRLVASLAHRSVPAHTGASQASSVERRASPEAGRSSGIGRVST